MWNVAVAVYSMSLMCCWVLPRRVPFNTKLFHNFPNKSTCYFATNITAPNLTKWFSPTTLETCLGAHLLQWCELMMLCAESPNDCILVLMYFWLHEGLRFIKLVWAALHRELNIITHLVNGFTTADWSTAGKPLENISMELSTILLLAFRMATKRLI